MKHSRLVALCLVALCTLCLLPTAPLRAQANRWFGWEQADSTRWGWNLVFYKLDGFYLPNDTTGSHMFDFSYVATDTLKVRERGYRVVFNGYWMSRTEVTQGQWILVMGSPLPHWTERGDQLPALASHEEIEAFLSRLNSIRSLNLRLPTPDELAFAYKGGHYSEGYRYSGSNRLEWVAWTDGKLHPVAQKVPNELGFFDMDTHDGGFRIAYSQTQEYYDTSK